MADELQLEGQLDFRGKPRAQYQTVNDEPSMTVQSDAVKADIKTILKKHGVTGIVDHLAATDAQFMDVSELGDYADVMREVKTAETQFMKLPARVRALFDHDVAKWLDAAHDQEKRDAVVEEVNAEAMEAAGAGATAGDSGGATEGAATSSEVGTA